MSLISASYFVVPAGKKVLDCGACVVQIGAIGTSERMDLGAKKVAKLRSLLMEERKERRQMLLRTEELLPLLNTVNIADHFPDLLVRL